MNTDAYINRLLMKISLKKDVFYMEKRTYKQNRIYKNYLVKINNKKEEFNNKTDLLMYLSECDSDG